MAKKNPLKKTLLISGLSIAACATMLAGTTFAWFSSNVTVENEIVAGKLKIQLQHQDEEGEWVDAQGVKLFQEDTRWEPGMMAVSETFKIVNVGDLALQYELSVKELDTVRSIYGHGLSEVIDYKIVNAEDASALTEGLDRANAWEELENDVEVASGKLGGEYADETVELVAVLYWAPNSNEIDNLYNGTAEGGAALKTKFSLSVYATQYTYEKDSFGPEYDKDVPVNVVRQAVVQGAKDIQELMKGFNLPKGTSMSITDLDPDNCATVTFVNCDIMNFAEGYFAVANAIQAAVDEQIDNGNIEDISSIKIGGYPAGTINTTGSWLTNGIGWWGYNTLLTAEEQEEVDYLQSNGADRYAYMLTLAYYMASNLDGSSCPVSITTVDGVETVYTISFVVVAEPVCAIRNAVIFGVFQANSALAATEMGTEDDGYYTLDQRIEISPLDENNAAEVYFNGCNIEDFAFGYMAVGQEIENAVTKHRNEISSIRIANMDIEDLSASNWLTLGLGQWGYDELLQPEERDALAQYVRDNNIQDVTKNTGYIFRLAGYMVKNMVEKGTTHCSVEITTVDGVTTTYTLTFIINDFNGDFDITL